MAFIKLDNGKWINTNHIAYMEPRKNENTASKVCFGTVITTNNVYHGTSCLSFSDVEYKKIEEFLEKRRFKRIV